MKKALIGVSAILGIALVACGSLSEPSSPAQEQPEARVFTGTPAFASLAQNLARSLADPELRRTVRAAALERFDGDTEVLYNHLLKRPLTNGGTFESRLTTQAATMSAPAQRNPLLQVAVRGNVEVWDPNSYAPLVAFVPDDVDDEKLETVTAYDVQGNAVQLDARTPPSQPVIVLGTNERTEDNGALLPQFDPAVAQQTAEGEVSTLEGECGSRPKGAESINHFIVRNDHEPWTAGDPEIMVQVGSQRAGRSVYQGSFPGVKQGYYYHPSRNVVSWSVGTIGNYIMYFWYERDGGQNITINLDGTFRGVTVGVKYTLQNSDDQLGHALVDVSQRYHASWHNTGDVEWQRSSCH